ncbi:MAG: Lar family restriction alleviation protein [Rhodocyclaceae bacterium]|nr:Lar family restriction alleviation protein [Rhodocyclaceae bacterium]
MNTVDVPLPMPCPFCGQSPESPIYVHGDVTGWVVWCGACGSQGPAVQGDTTAARRAALRLWNQRAK